MELEGPVNAEWLKVRLGIMAESGMVNLAITRARVALFIVGKPWCRFNKKAIKRNSHSILSQTSKTEKKINNKDQKQEGFSFVFGSY